ncbi:peptide deformylase [Mycoplasmopsis ciconiae]|uniref:Peptide deformylase n=1 Tax=Mycoplasmopsis ciconiae TaxID=561067 RepID=A0ABU7MLQ7_9BACT|nr:peptide deformylase [Mycoplasmopsis ciconiae]
MFNVKLVELPKKVLREISKEVTLPLSKEDDLLAQKMIYHVDDSQKPNTKFRPAVGVAAVQYGVLKRMFYVHVKNFDTDETIFSDVIINPVVLSKSFGKQALSEGEGCLSVPENYPNQEGYIRRATRIKIKCYSYKQQKEVEYDLTGYVAIVFQHELDHLDGKLFIDRIKRSNPWEKEKDLILM